MVVRLVVGGGVVVVVEVVGSQVRRSYAFEQSKKGVGRPYRIRGGRVKGERTSGIRYFEFGILRESGRSLTSNRSG